MNNFNKEEELLLYKVLSLIEDMDIYHLHSFHLLIKNYINNYVDNLNEDSAMSINDLLQLLNRYGLIMIESTLDEVDIHHLHFIDLKEFYFWIICYSNHEASIEISSIISSFVVSYDIELHNALRSR